MYGLMKNEIIKAFARKKLWFFLIVQFLFGVVPLILRIFTDAGQTYPLFLHGLTISWIIPIYIAILTADMIAEEYDNGTLVLSLVHPVTRGELLAAKVLSLFALTVFILIVTMAIGYAAGTAALGWGSRFLHRGIEYTSARGTYLTIFTYLCSAVPLFAFGLLVTFLAFLLGSSGAVVGISIGTMLLSTALGYLVPEAAPYLVTNHFGSFSQSLLFSRNLPEAELGLKVMAVYGILSYVCSYALFRSRDLVN